MADKFLTEIEHSKIAGSYRDADGGQVALRSRVVQHKVQPWTGAQVAALRAGLPARATCRCPGRRAMRSLSTDGYARRAA